MENTEFGKYKIEFEKIVKQISQGITDAIFVIFFYKLLLNCVSFMILIN